MTDRFSDATAVRATGDGRYEGAALPGWDIAGNSNGGYVMAIAGRAMSAQLGRPPATVTGHYLAPVQAGPVEISVEPVRSGRTFATARATLRQGDRVALELLGTFGDAVEHPVRVITGSPPELPDFDDPSLTPTDEALANRPAFNSKVDLRLRPADGGFAVGAPSGRAEIAGWFALLDDEPIDEIALLMAGDAFPPPVFNLDLPIGWVPTVEFTVHVRARPAPGPLRARFWSDSISAGRLTEDGELWDVEGNLVAVSRQLALVPRAEGL